MAPHWLQCGGHLGSIRVPRMRFGLGSSQIFSRRIFKILGRYVGVSKNRGTPKSSIFNRVFHYKPSILGYPYIWKHLCICTAFICSFTFSCSSIFHSAVHIHTNFHTHIDTYSHFGFVVFVSPPWNACDVLTSSNFDTSVQGERPWGETVTEPWGRIAAKWPWCFVFLL